ncbi:protein dpy-30 [Trypanosoma cruzi]|nr:protein dpy-30 [Trypanosoma cruzi]
MEENLVDFTLTEEELQAVEELVEEWFQHNDRATQLRETIASMERVLAMRIRLQPAAKRRGVGRHESQKAKRTGKVQTRQPFRKQKTHHRRRRRIERTARECTVSRQGACADDAMASISCGLP